jgi:hypothetical protein
MWKMPNFRRLGLWGHFLGRGIKSPVPCDWEAVVYILLNFVKFLKK